MERPLTLPQRATPSLLCCQTIPFHSAQALRPVHRQQTASSWIWDSRARSQWPNAAVSHRLSAAGSCCGGRLDVGKPYLDRPIERQLLQIICVERPDAHLAVVRAARNVIAIFVYCDVVNAGLARRRCVSPAAHTAASLPLTRHT